MIRAEESLTEAPVAGLPVSLFQGPRRVAAGTTDIDGKFTLGNVSGGLYRVVVHAADGPTGGLYRLWAPSAAPPHADRAVVIPIRGGVVRGQSPFGIPHFPRAVAIGVIAAGAFATPIIYHNVKRDHSIPASP